MRVIYPDDSEQIDFDTAFANTGDDRQDIFWPVTSSGTLVQAFLAAVAASLLVLFGYPHLGTIMGCAGALLALLLLAVNWRAIRIRRDGWIAWTVIASPLLLAVGPCLALLEAPEVREGAPHHAIAVLAITILGTTVFMALYLSSLVDWCYIFPRLRGGTGIRPCTDSLNPYWRRITRIWLLHRLIATIALVAATVAVVAIAANEWVLGLNQVVAAALAAAATVLAGFYLARLPFAVAIMVNPPLHVGDKIKLAEAFPLPAACPDYFVSEVSLEGVKLVELDDGDVRTRPGPDRSYDRMLDLTEIHKLLRARDTFAPCRECKGVHPYCGRSPSGAPVSSE